MCKIIIIDSGKKYFDKIANLHINGISEGFLSTLGNNFLAKLYEGIKKAPGSGVYIAVSDNEVLGFIAYTKDIKACYKNVLKSKWFSLSWALLPNFFRLSIYIKMFETLSYPNNNKAKDNIHPELLSIAVSDKCRGKGVGKLLVKRLEEEFLKMDINKYYVVTLAVDKLSNAFYTSCGFVLCKEFVNHAKPMNEYIKLLNVNELNKFN